MDILIYAGPGVSPACLHHTLSSLRAFLPVYAIRTVLPADLATGLWRENCALFVVPGGRDLPYTQQVELLQLKQYVEGGGAYLGLCAGAYFACSEIEFAVDDPLMRVVGPRPLKFFKGRAVGPAFAGFEYNSEKGARVVSLSSKDGEIWSYFNGGCSFVSSDDSQTMTRYSDLDSSVSSVFTTPGHGRAVLCGAHVEFPLTSEPALSQLSHLSPEELARRERARKAHWACILRELGLHVSEDGPVSCEPILAVCAGAGVADKLRSLFADGVYEGEDKMFVLDESLAGDEGLTMAIEDLDSNAPKDQLKGPQRLISRLSNRSSLLLFSDVTTSTQDILKKNLSLLNACPQNAVFFANQQLAGRGRTSNAWSSPPGCLLFSTIAHLPSHVSPARAIFAQYLMAMAIPLSQRATEFKSSGLRLKWPNDIYTERGGQMRKIGGVVVDTQSHIGGGLDLIIGVGFNFSNKGPNACFLDCVPSKQAANLHIETFLEQVLMQWWLMWEHFIESGGMFDDFISDYLDLWLHSDQEVTETRLKRKLRLTGISMVNGFLQGEPTTFKRDSRTGEIIRSTVVEMMPDGNSFNMMKGLISAKA